MDELLQILEEFHIPYAYDHFAEGEAPKTPFLCYLLPASNNFAADGRVYHRFAEVRIELYTDKKSPRCERDIENVLDAHGLFYNKTEVWIESEKLYEVTFVFEMEVTSCLRTK